jgi:5-methylcytosine-specific restriction enzyme subunit McrC
MRQLQLVEHETTRAVRLTRVQREALREAVPELAISPSREVGRFDLTPGSWVGAVLVPGLVVWIEPKLPIRNILFLISYALDPDTWRSAPVGVSSDATFVEAIVPLFLNQTAHAIRRGLLHGYVTREDALPTLRGRLRFEPHLRRVPPFAPPLEVTFQDHTPDTCENQILKAALRQLCRLPLRTPGLSARVRRLLGRFELVSERTPVAVAMPPVTYTRLNAHYRRALELARLILHGASITLSTGQVPGAALLVDMDKVFEDFVAVALREALSLSPRQFPQGAAGHSLTLDRAGTLDLRPDLSWWEGTTSRFVGDVKYKRTTQGEPADLYQLLAYATATDLPAALLVYAAGPEDALSGTLAVHEIARAGKTLHVTALNVGGSPDQILAQIELLARRVRRLRQPHMQERNVCRRVSGAELTVAIQGLNGPGTRLAGSRAA